MASFCNFKLSATRMFIFLCLLFVVRVHTKPAQMNTLRLTLRKVVEICREQTGATEADAYEILVLKEAATRMEAKCFRACLMKNFNLMDANGKFNRTTALEIANRHVSDNAEKMRIATEIVDICYNMEVSSNHCEAAEQYGKCANDYVATTSTPAQSSHNAKE